MRVQPLRAVQCESPRVAHDAPRMYPVKTLCPAQPAVVSVAAAAVGAAAVAAPAAAAAAAAAAGLDGSAAAAAGLGGSVADVAVVLLHPMPLDEEVHADLAAVQIWMAALRYQTPA